METLLAFIVMPAFVIACIYLIFRHLAQVMSSDRLRALGTCPMAVAADFSGQ